VEKRKSITRTWLRLGGKRRRRRRRRRSRLRGLNGY
jgi:hypothetical protein